MILNITVPELAREEKRNFWIFFAVWITVFLFNKALVPKSWFLYYHLKTYSCGHIFSLAFYFAASMVYINIARLFHKKQYFWASAVMSGLFLQELLVSSSALIALRLGMLFAGIVGMPLFLKWVLRIPTHAAYLWGPLFVWGSCCFIFGRDSTLNFSGVILAGSLFYLTALLEINVEKMELLSQGPQA